MENRGPAEALPGESRAQSACRSVEELIDAYGDDVLRLCVLYLGDRHLAEDAFQVTMTKAWRQLASFRGQSSEKTWLCRIAANTCRDMLRTGFMRFRKRCEPLEALPELAALPPDERRGDVRDAVLALPGKYREAVVLYYFEDMKQWEIAELLRLPVHTVSTRLRRAKALLAKALNEEERT